MTAKKHTFLLLILCTALFCCGCQNNSAGSADTDSTKRTQVIFDYFDTATTVVGYDEDEAHFNEVWSEVTGNVDKEEVSAKAYDAIFEVDDAIVSLVEKVGECVKEIAVNKMYGGSPLSDTRNGAGKE